ncbi:MAG: hypothetical protein ACOX6D_09180 [Thermoguttaceae bacterium]|jgi:acyl carrier protein
MTPESFYAELSDIFDEPISAETSLKSCAAWSSSTSLSVIVTAEELSGYRPTPSDLLRSETAGELYALIERASRLS